MNLRDLSAEIARHAATLHPLTDTNAQGVAIEGGSVVIAFDTSALDNEIEDLKIGEDALNAEVKELKEANAAFELRAELAERLIDEVKYEDEKGQTLRHYVKEACEAGLSAEKWKRGYVEMRSECEALRKRKGVTVNLFACEREVLALLAQIWDCKGRTLPELRPEAEKLRAKLFASPSGS